jgi:20S proteasome alpha/beta subunit
VRAAMTLLVALRGVDGIVVASDSRGTFGDPRGVTAQNDAQKKLYRASKHAAILTAGSGELGATVMAEALTLIQENDSVNVVLEKTRNLVREKYSQWFPQFALQPNPQGHPVRPDLGLLIAGYDIQPDGPQVQKIFQLQSGLDFAPMLHNYGFALLGVAQYALYLLNRLYQNDSSVDKLKPLAGYAITETASQDGKVGGPVQMATIMPPDGCKELSQAEIDAIVTSNAQKNTTLKDSFFKGKPNETGRTNESKA